MRVIHHFMNRLLSLIVLVLCYPLTSTASVQDLFGSCEETVSPAPLEGLFNGEFRRQLPVGPQTRELAPPTEDEYAKMEEQYREQLHTLRRSFALTGINLLPMSFYTADENSIFYRRELHIQNLVGREVVGCQELREFPETNGARREFIYAVKNYFAGTVTKIEEEGSDTKITLATLEGIDRVIRVSLYESIIRSFELFVLGPQQSEEKIFRDAVRGANFEEVMEKAFGSPLEKGDYDMAAAIVQTYLKMPPTWGASAALKIILGRTIRGGESYPFYGLARGKSRYNEAAIKKFLGPLDTFMVATDVLSLDETVSDVEDGPERPEWIAKFDKTLRAPLLENYFLILQKEKGGADLKIEPKKLPPPGSKSLTKDTAKAGTVLIVQNEIGLESKSEMMPHLMVRTLAKGDSTFKPVPGSRIEIVKGPRKIDGANYARIKDPATGAEGEVFWGHLKLSTKLE